MSELQQYADIGARRPAGTGRQRTFLFLQGPISTFFDQLGRELIARGHRVRRINLHLGDRLYWRLPATDYRGRLADWRPFIADFLAREQVTDLVVHGDRRTYHLVAAEEARVRGIAVLATDLGYVRPDWLTLEYDGMTTYSRFPRDPAAIRSLAARFPEPDLEPRFHTPFWLIAALDVAYNIGLVFGRPLYPFYSYHSTCHPFAEYAGWLASRAKRLAIASDSAAAKLRLQQMPKSYFLVPLQIATDFQIRAHSPYSDQRAALRDILSSFARSGSGRRLVFVVHPLDNGLIAWPRLIARIADELGVADRVETVLGGTPLEILRNAAGIVTINSTVGATALYHGVPVKALGNAIFNICGLTCQESLDAFWQGPVPADPALMRDFMRALIGTTQVKGGYYEKTSRACAVAGFVDRLERLPHPLPAPDAAELASRRPRPATRTVAAVGVSGALGAALARARATPGTTLHLIDRSAAALTRVAEDCRYRGAVVETHRLSSDDGAALGQILRAIDRASAIDELVVHGSCGATRPRSPSGVGDLLAMMDAVAAVSFVMRRRRRGEIVLAAAAAGQPMPADAEETARHAASLRAYAGGLRHRLAPDGVAVSVVLPSRLGLRLAARWKMPDLVECHADATAARFGTATASPVIAVPGPVSLLARAFRRMPSRFGERARGGLFPARRTRGVPVDADLAVEPASAE